MTDHKKRQIVFWKKHQTLLKLCSDLSISCGVKILVHLIFFQPLFQTTN